jgi:aldose 1-epimerase
MGQQHPGHQYPSGEQWTLRHGDLRATVVEVGGGLRTLTSGGRDVLAGYGVDEMASAGRGQLLMPWPNRLRDGRYRFDGQEQQLALSEPARGNASHGLVRWALWSLLERSESSLTVGYRLHPQQGWSGRLDLTVRYELSDHGLAVTTTATNVGSNRVPFGYGAHPYLALGETRLSDAVLTVPASEQVLVDDRRKLPTGTAPVEQGGRDFRQARPLGSTRLDTAFAGLDRDGEGRWQVTLAGLVDRPDVSVWGDRAFGWVQVFTDKGEDEGVDGVRGIAVEPLTCPADAFNSGEGLLVLEPGQQWSGQWGVVLHG